MRSWRDWGRNPAWKNLLHEERGIRTCREMYPGALRDVILLTMGDGATQFVDSCLVRFSR